MLFNQFTFIGIDPTAGKRPITYAALDKDLRLLALAEGTFDEVVAFVTGQQSVFVAMCAPVRPNQGLMRRDDVRESLQPVPRPGRWTGFRVAEYQLYQHKIRIPRTPVSKGKTRRWMLTAFRLVERLQQHGFVCYPQDEAELQILETYPHAVFTVLLGHRPFPKNSLEGRIQRQLVLYEMDVEITDPMRVFEEITRYRLLQGILSLDDLYRPQELDAIAAAYTAWKAALHPDGITLVGHPEEGQIVLPVKSMKERY